MNIDWTSCVIMNINWALKLCHAAPKVRLPENDVNKRRLKKAERLA